MLPDDQALFAEIARTDPDAGGRWRAAWRLDAAG